MSRGLCDVSLRTDVIANNLRQALTEYAAYKMAQAPTGKQSTPFVVHGYCRVTSPTAGESHTIAAKKGTYPENSHIFCIVLLN